MQCVLSGSDLQEKTFIAYYKDSLLYEDLMQAVIKIRAKKDLLIHLLILCQHKFVPKKCIIECYWYSKSFKRAN